MLITGASGGIGAATARLAAAQGASIIAHYHHNAAAARDLCDDLPSAAFPAQADLRDEGSVDDMFVQALAHFGRVDCLVANAGIWPEEESPVHEMSTKRWHDTIAINLTGTFLCCRAFLRHVAEAKREHASIVLVGSTAAIFGEAGHADYAAAKAGMVYGLLPSLKNEITRIATRGRVNAVCPGWTDTPMAASGTADPAAMARAFTTMPLKKIATPEDVAAAIVFLSSDTLAGHISGAVLPVAGGMEGRVVE